MMDKTELDDLIERVHSLAEDEEDVRWIAAKEIEELREEIARLTQLHESAAKKGEGQQPAELTLSSSRPSRRRTFHCGKGCRGIVATSVNSGDKALLDWQAGAIRVF